MGRYKRYLITGGDIPSSTKRMRNLRNKKRAEAQLNSVETRIVEQNQQNPLSIDNEPSMEEYQPSPVSGSNDGPAAVNVPPDMIWEIADSTRPTLQPAEPQDTPVTEVHGDSAQSSTKASEEQYTAMTETEPDFEDYLPPLCSHTECTANDVMLMVLSLGLRHKLTWVAMVDILKMFNSIYGEKKITASTYGITKQLFENEDLSVSYHYYCNNCCVYIKKSSFSFEEVVCEFCDGNSNRLKKADYFVSLSIESQLKNLMAHENIAEMIMKYRFQRTKINEANLEDIYDGSEYKKLSAPGEILSFPEIFCYSFFTGGVAMGKSKKSLWPIYISIHEICPEERRNHILLVGLYCGPRDPNQQVFLRPFVEEANKLARDGFSWTYKSTLRVSKVIPLVAVADSVARCQLLNFQTFSAFYGCTFCYQKTTHTAKRLKYTLPNKPVQERTPESTEYDLIQVYNRRHESNEKDRSYKGVKGPSALSSLLYFNLHSGVNVEYMHNILLGCTKSFFELIFESTRRKVWNLLEDQIYAMEDVMSEIDERLKYFKPPTSVTRTPRSIKDFGVWKANEWRNWLLFYSIPCLSGLLKDKHLIHLAMLSKATSLLLQKSVSQSEVYSAHRLFQLFSFYFQQYFGPEYMYYNIHLLSHICKGVLRWGPLWTHNAFMFEGYNRQLLYLCKNPFQVVKEISKRYLVMNAVPRMIKKFSSCDNTIFFCEDVLERKLIRFKSCNSCVLLGAGKNCNLTENEKIVLDRNTICPSECLFYDRMLFKSMRITTAEYASGQKNDDSVFYTKCGDCYEVAAIILTAGKTIHLLARALKISRNEILASQDVTICHISKIAGFGDLEMILPDCIGGQCVVDKQFGMFLSKLPLSYSYGD